MTWGQQIEKWLDAFPPMQKWKDPMEVWRFQERFGVRKVSSSVQVKQQHEKFVSVDDDLLRSRKKHLWHQQQRQQQHKTEGVASSSSLVLSSSGYSSDVGDDDEGANVVRYKITNKFWYWLFFLGTQLGDETYYSIFFSFWFWNIDGAVGRRVMLVWNLVMYIGQGMKDVVRWPRPAMPTVVQLESKWALEYGMPSTHAMVGLAVPMSILYFTVGRYQYPFWLWAVMAVTWCTLVCTSRIYLGMHSFADIYVGLAFSSFLLLFILPLVERSDDFLLSHPFAPIVTIMGSILACVFYPGSDRWTPARGDTMIIVGSYLGVQLGAWCNFHLGLMTGPPLPPPYPILWPTYEVFGQTALRMVVGGVVLVATRAIFKPTSYFLSCCAVNANMNELKRQPNDISNKAKIFAELSTKFHTYIAMGFVTMFVVPIVFQAMSIERSTFYTEI